MHVDSIQCWLKGHRSLKNVEGFFFAHLSGLAVFFSRSSIQLFDSICQWCLPHVAPTRWQCSSRLVSTIFEKSACYSTYWKIMMSTTGSLCAVLTDTVRTWMILSFVVCFPLFHVFFEYSDVLFGILQNNALDVQFCLARADEFCDTIERKRGWFGEIWWVYRDIRAQYQKLHSDILDNILSQIWNRLKDYKKVMFLSILDPQLFQTYQKKIPKMQPSLA